MAEKNKLNVSILKQIPRGVWALGFVSMFMDISSEMIHALLPIYMVTVLGTSTLAVGIIEGIAEATASITKVFSGALSDWLGKRKLLAVIGYGLAAFTKPVFPLASSLRQPALLTGSAKAFVVRQETLSWLISRLNICAELLLAFANRLIQLARLSAHFWLSASCCSPPIIFKRYFGWPSFQALSRSR
jgi:Na+/melibiose symporter-like transporter